MPSAARTDQLLQQFRSFCTSGYLLTRPYKKWNVPINHFCSSVDVSKTWDWHTFVLTSIANCEPNNLDAYHANANSSHSHMKVFTQLHESCYIQSFACSCHYEYRVKLLMVWAKIGLCSLIFFHLNRPSLVVTRCPVGWFGWDSHQSSSIWSRLVYLWIVYHLHCCPYRQQQRLHMQTQYTSLIIYVHASLFVQLQFPNHQQRKSLLCLPQPSQKSNFPPPTTKSDL